MNFCPSEAKRDKIEKVHRSARVGWCEARVGWCEDPCRLESQVWREILCPWPAPNLSRGRFSELHPGCRVCPGMLCHGNSASLLGWWSHTFCTSVLDCAMRRLGEVISKIFCTLRTVEELTSLSSLFVPSIFPSWCLLRSWCVVPAVVVEDRGPHAEERAGHSKPPSLPSLPASFFPPPTQYWTNILEVNREGQLWMIFPLSPTSGSYSNQLDS